MHIKNIEIKELNIPFAVSFKHASAERKATQSILVMVHSENGCMGVGEGCPREYVTSESVASALLFLNNIKEDLYKLTSLELLKAYVKINRNSIDNNPAAWCAAELALLDVMGRESGQTLEELLETKALKGPFVYSAILGDSKLEMYQGQVDRYAKLGFKDFKLKISGEVEKDKAKLKYLEQRIGDELRLRLDANNLWKNAAEAIEYFDNINSLVFAVEEPIKAFDYEGMAEVAQKMDVKIILDESFLSVSHFENLKNLPNVFVVNIRVSKMGGLLRSLEVAQKCMEQGIGVVVGAQVGETSILTRAALMVAQMTRPQLIGQEGAFGKLLLERDVVEQPLTFGPLGLLDIGPLQNSRVTGNGLGYWNI